MAAVDRGDDVAVLDAGLRGRGAGDHFAHQRAVRRGQAESLGVRPVEVLDVDAEIAAADLPLLAQLRQDLLEGVDGNGEADVLGAVVDGAGDAHDPALQVDQGAAGVAEVDGGVGLQEVLERDVVDAERAALGADHAGGHGLVQVERVADHHHPVADPGAVAVAELQVLEAGAGIDLEQRQVGRRVGALDLRGVVAVAEMDLDLRGAFDDVIVGDDQAVGRDDEAAAAGLGAIVLGRLLLRDAVLVGPARSAGPSGSALAAITAAARAEEELERIDSLSLSLSLPSQAPAPAEAVRRFLDRRGLDGNDRRIHGLRQIGEAGQAVGGGFGGSTGGERGVVGLSHPWHRHPQPPRQDHSKDNRFQDQHEGGYLATAGCDHERCDSFQIASALSTSKGPARIISEENRGSGRSAQRQNGTRARQPSAFLASHRPASGRRL